MGPILEYGTPLPSMNIQKVHLTRQVSEISYFSMTENDTVCSLNKKEATAFICVHLWAAQESLIGFNVPKDIENDLEAWCDECEHVLNSENEWTDKAVEFADFRPSCVGCFISLKNRMRV
jgi:hypothetical protein